LIYGEPFHDVFLVEETPIPVEWGIPELNKIRDFAFGGKRFA